MLNKEENELVTRVGPGTSMGEVLRRYWMPFLLCEELPEADCPPIHVRLLGEDLVAFRDSDGHVGLLDELCPHRLASLFLGRNEEGGLRCVYHGWKFDVDGRCVDMPNEPADSVFKDKVQLLSYPTIELGGVIWAYLGPTELKPEPPGMEWLRAPETHRYVSKTVEFANYVQAIEGGIDTSHSSFLHNNRLSDKKSLGQIDRSPRLEVEKTDYGFRYAGIRDARDKGNYVRIYQFIMPFHQFRSGQIDKSKAERPDVPLIKGHMWSPVDDETTCVFNWMYAVDQDRPLTPEFILESETSAGRGPDGETGTRHRTRENNWLIDRAAQRNKTYTGITGLNTQDLAVQESMGRIVERWREHLGTTDRAIITMRQIMLSAIRDVREGGDPPGVNPASYRGVRATDLILPKETRWQEAAERELIAAR
jgi:phenylpropionate dioxygenase-like ring-hydroxylating dioxygenase large terminal subunit